MSRGEFPNDDLEGRAALSKTESFVMKAILFLIFLWLGVSVCSDYLFSVKNEKDLEGDQTIEATEVIENTNHNIQ